MWNSGGLAQSQACGGSDGVAGDPELIGDHLGGSSALSLTRTSHEGSRGRSNFAKKGLFTS